MSRNINQIFIANPITSNVSTDLMYFGQSPYGAVNDAAMTYANFSAQFGAPYTASALTEVNDTNVTLTLGGTPNTALLQAVSITAGWTGTLSGTRGGTGVNNGSSTITIGGNVTFSGGFTFTGTLTGTTSVTFPTSGTLATTSQIPSGAALTEVNDTNVTLTLGGSPATALVNAASITAGWAGQLSVGRGGTGVSSVTITPTATAWAGWDANKNLSANSHINGYTTTATAATTTTLTVGSTYQQFFTGTTTQTVLLPVTSTLVLGQQFEIVNNSTGTVTVQSSGSNTIQAMAANTILTVTCILTSGTTAASWYADYSLQNALTLPLSLANGGTNANLTASNGGIFYSTASAGAILAGTATANQVLLSGSSTTPAWSTATYPATTTINQILYSSASNTITGITAVNSAVLSTNGSGVPSLSTTLPSGIAATNMALTTPSLGTPSSGTLTNCTGLPVAGGGTGNSTFTAFSVICAGTTATGAFQNVVGLGSSGNILTSNGAGALPTWQAAPTGGITNVNQNTSSATLAANNRYVTNNGASLVTYTLPASAAIGDTYIIVGGSSGGWKVAQGSGQQCHLGSSATTSGATGSLASSNQYDCITVTCITANTTFAVYGAQGNITVV